MTRDDIDIGEEFVCDDKAWRCTDVGGAQLSLSAYQITKTRRGLMGLLRPWMKWFLMNMIWVVVRS